MFVDLLCMHLVSLAPTCLNLVICDTNPVRLHACLCLCVCFSTQAAQQKLIEEEQRREQELRDREIEEYRKQSQVAVARYRKMLDDQANKQRELAAIRAREEEEEKRKQLKVTSYTALRQDAPLVSFMLALPPTEFIASAQLSVTCE